MLPVLQLGPIALQVPGLIVLISVWFGLSIAEKNAPNYKLNPAQLYNLSIVALVGGILGARITYAVRYLTVFIDSPISLLSLNPGLLDPWGGIATAVIVALIFGQRRQIPFWGTLDALTPGIAVLLIGMALSNLASGKGYGLPTAVPWALPLWGYDRHPTQIYEALAGGFILVSFWPRRGWLNAVSPGHTFLRFIATSAGVCLFLEAWRGDSQLLLYGIRSTQLTAWLLLAVALVMLTRLNSHTRDGQEDDNPASIE